MRTFSLLISRALRTVTFALVIGVIALPTQAETTNTNSNNVSTSKAVSGLLNDIKLAERKLASTQSAISNKQASLAKKIFTKEQDLTKLRTQAALNRRLADEGTLTLGKLQTRLDTWQQQQQYQTNLLTRFVREQSAKDHVASEQQPLLAEVLTVIKQQQQALYPQFNKQTIVLANGDLAPANTLQVGPVAWFSSHEAKIAGLLNTAEQTDIAQVGLIQNEEGDHPLNNAIKALQTGSQQSVLTELTFDPSLNRMIASQAQHENALEHIKKGGLWAIPIMAFACFALVIALFKALQLIRLAKIKLHSQGQLTQLFTNNNSNEFKGMQQQLFQLSLDTEKGSARDDQLFNQLTFNKHQLENWVGAIAITASVSPLLGLLGTVSGMIETFKMMTLFGSGDPEVVSGGIAQALITTELGLVVAIPALVLNALLSRKVKSYYTQLEAFAVQLSQLEKNNV